MTHAWRGKAYGLALAVGGAALALAGGAGPAAAATAITNCGVAIAQAGTYFLPRDLSCTGTAITIVADNVRLVLGGRTLTGDGSGDGILAQGTPDDPITGLSVEGPGTVTGFIDRVSISGARVARVTATGNVNNGITVNSLSPGARVIGNAAAGNDFGIFVDNSEGCEVAGNRTDDNEFDGIPAQVTPRSRFAGNAGARNGESGLELIVCAGCEATGNRASENGAEGFSLAAVTNSLVAGNTAVGNAAEGIGLIRSDNDGNLVQGNVTTGNGAGGIRVAEGATGNRLVGNRATGKAPADLRDENATASPCANAWLNNQFATDSEGDGPEAGCVR